MSAVPFKMLMMNGTITSPLERNEVEDFTTTSQVIGCVNNHDISWLVCGEIIELFSA